MRDLELLRVLEFIERTRGPFRVLFPDAPTDPFWNVVAFLVHAEVRGEATTQSALAEVAGVPYTTAIRYIDGWIASGLIERRPAGPKRNSLHASADLLDRFMAYARHVKSLVAETTGARTAGEAEDDYYFGAAKGRLTPPPDLRERLADLGHIRFLVHDDAFFVAMQNLWADFRDKHGSRRDFELLALSDLHAEARANARRAVSEYDVIVLNVPWLGEFADAGEIRVAEPFLFQSGIDSLDFDPRIWNMGRWRGRQHAVPLFASIEIMAARRDWFEEGGQPYPRTFDDVLRVGRRFHAPAKRRYGVVWNAAAGMPIASSFAFVLGCCGGAVLDLPRQGAIWSLQAIDTRSIGVTLATREAREALGYLHALLEISPPDALDLDWDTSLDVFMKGHAAMAYCWSMRAVRLETDMRSRLKGRVRYLPQAAGPGGRNICPLGGFLLAVPANLPEERVHAAFAAIRWMASPEAIKTQHATNIPVLPRFSISADPGIAGGSALVNFVNDLARRDLLATWQRPPLPFYQRVESILGEEIHAALRREKTDESALHSAAERIMRELRQRRATSIARRENAAAGSR